MYVVKRDGTHQSVEFDKITERIKNLMVNVKPELTCVDASLVTQRVSSGIVAGITTVELDELASQASAYMSTIDPEYSQLAARIAVSNLQKECPKMFSECIVLLRTYFNEKTNKPCPLISESLYNTVLKNQHRIDSEIVHDRDFLFDYFGFKTLTKSYLLRMKDKVIETPQYMFMRVALGIHGEDLESTFETYHLLSQKYFIHATPTLYASGTVNPQLSSCFLLMMKSDSIDGIFDTVKQCALISRRCGGIGLAISNIRCSGSYIAGTNGHSSGIVPFLRVFNDVARAVNQGSRRNGSIACYLEPFHADIMAFLDLKKPTGKEEIRCRDLFFGLFVPDLFMERVESDNDWSLFCPSECPELFNTYGSEHRLAYENYERQGKARKVVKAREVWAKIIESQVETGGPYMIYKDAVNFMSNQKHSGMIHSSNLCVEVNLLVDEDEIAVCNLASVNLQACVHDGIFDHDRLFKIVQTMTKNLNKIIDNNQYPLPETKTSNLRHRPIGMGVQGLADVFIRLRLPFESPEAKRLNREIFETIYYAGLDASCDLAMSQGYYETYPGSPASKGLLHFDLRREYFESKGQPFESPLSGRWDWGALKLKIAQYGLRNSVITALMPTASTAQILGNNEAFEPYTSNIYSRRVIAGEFIVLNNHLLKDLKSLGLWSPEMKNEIMLNKGSIQSILSIPLELRDLYKTVWEISQKVVVDLAADRSAFVDQSQSMNIHMAAPSYQNITSMHFYGWKKNLKSGLYYLRGKSAAEAIQFTVEKPMKSEEKAVEEVCTMKEGCVSCSS